MKKILLLSAVLLSACQSSGTPADASEGERKMAEMMGVTVEELRQQTPEDHMQMMMQMQNRQEDVHAQTKKDISNLPEAKASEILEIADGDRIELNPTLVKKTIQGKEFAMYGYNGQIPGPMLSAKQATTFTVVTKNEIDMKTTIHWHGLRHDSKDDGVPGMTQDPIQPNESYTYTVKVPDEGVYWYHPHVREDIQQDMGLYGNILVQPEKEEAYEPVHVSTFLVLDDFLVDVQGNAVAYGEKEAKYALMGRFGNVLLVNGAPAEEYNLQIAKGSVVRFYLTNVANTRTFSFTIPGSKIKRIASDIGRYEREEWTDAIVIAPAERYVVDAYFPDEGSFSVVHNSPLATENLGTVTVTAETAQPNYAASFQTLHTNQDVTEDINAYRKYFDAPVEKTLLLDVSFVGSMGGMNHGAMSHDESGIEWEDTMPGMNEIMTAEQVDWKLIDKATGKENMAIDWQFTKGDVVKIRIENNEESAHPMQHPIHVHGQRFLVLSMDGVENTNLVWKDTVLVPTGSTADILVDMSNPGSWMIHCHIAEHLTDGMMSTFTVNE